MANSQIFQTNKLQTRTTIIIIYSRDRPKRTSEKNWWNFNPLPLVRFCPHLANALAADVLYGRPWPLFIVLDCEHVTVKKNCGKMNRLSDKCGRRTWLCGMSVRMERAGIWWVRVREIFTAEGWLRTIFVFSRRSPCHTPELCQNLLKY